MLKNFSFFKIIKIKYYNFYIGINNGVPKNVLGSPLSISSTVLANPKSAIFI